MVNSTVPMARALPLMNEMQRSGSPGLRSLPPRLPKPAYPTRRLKPGPKLGRYSGEAMSISFVVDPLSKDAHRRDGKQRPPAIR